MILNIIAGIMLVLLLPGFLLSHLLFKKLSYLEQITIGICLSIIISFSTSIFLGIFKADKFLYSFTPNNITIGLITILAVIVLIFIRETYYKN